MREFGEMVEWSITPVLKTGVLRGTGGSNPSLSAHTKEKGSSIGLPFFVSLLKVFAFCPTPSDFLSVTCGLGVRLLRMLGNKLIQLFAFSEFLWCLS